jgi:hypothetical protein
MQDISWENPPFPFIEQLSKSSHVAISTYIDLWRRQDKENNVYIFRDEIGKILSIPKTKFYYDILKLAKEGVLHWDERPEGLERTLITISLTPWSADFDYD